MINRKIPDMYIPFEYTTQQIGGYLGHWIDINIEDELLNFPLDQYLWPYKNGGISNGRWPVGEYLGKYMHAMTFAYQYSKGATQRKLKERIS